ncbi:MAG: GlsB/YeaQ/YmgE family stress response membrane protein [Bacteroidota bacterium]
MLSGLIFWIIVGAAAGWLAEKIMKADMGLGMNIVVGIVGALIGGFIVDLLPFVSSDGGLIWSILVATLGAVVLLWGVNKFRKKSSAT